MVLLQILKQQNKDQDFDAPNVLDIWNFPKKDEFIKEGKIKFSQIYEDDIGPNKSHRTARQWLQIEKTNNNDNSINKLVNSSDLHDNLNKVFLDNKSIGKLFQFLDK